MSIRKIIGNYGEDLALKYLLRNGFNILDTNFSSRFGEIDIIAAKMGKIHFVEVKTRTGDYCGSPEEGLTRHKISRILKTCQNYIYSKRIDTDNYQLDLIAIEIDKKEKRAKIKHYRAIQLL